jgi:MFS family permease
VRSLNYSQLIQGNRNFRNLLAGQFISELGNWFNFIAGLGLVRVVSDASPTAAGIYFVCRLVPFALASPIAGTFVDRFSRRQVMIITDLARVGVAMMFLLVTSKDELWIAYIATILLSSFGAFFDGAKNAATPNLTGREGILAGTALMFSTRFLLMAIGSALGGWAAAIFGYEVAFLINAASFLVSAFTVWLIPEEATRDAETGERMAAKKIEKPSFITEMKEGVQYTLANRFALTIIVMNMIWATGGGGINVIYDRIGGIYFPLIEGWNPDVGVGLLWFSAGLGLTIGMLIAHRTSVWLDLTKRHSVFIGSTLIIHGILFSVAGAMPTLVLFSLFSFVSRLVIGVEYAIQETLFQRSLPDYIRGRISTLERGAELTVFGLSSYLASEAMFYINPQMLTVISGVLSAGAGVLWFVRHGGEQFTLGVREHTVEPQVETG